MRYIARFVVRKRGDNMPNFMARFQMKGEFPVVADNPEEAMEIAEGCLRATTVGRLEIDIVEHGEVVVSMMEGNNEK